jgi:hypothetical protein
MVVQPAPSPLQEPLAMGDQVVMSYVPETRLGGIGNWAEAVETSVPIKPAKSPNFTEFKIILPRIRPLKDTAERGFLQVKTG